MNRDILYILGTGSRWQDNEIRYSLRSVQQHMPHRRVFVVGALPAWLKNVVHIPAEDPYDNKLTNSVSKLARAVADRRLSREFVLMNDDFFMLQYTPEIRVWHRGPLSETTKERTGYYRTASQHAAKFLALLGIKDPLDYGVHAPIVLEKSAVRGTLAAMDFAAKPRPFLFRTVYGNMHDLGGTRRKDVKLRSAADVQKAGKLDCASITNKLALDPGFQAWIAERFPSPSHYESDAPKREHLCAGRDCRYCRYKGRRRTE